MGRPLLSVICLCPDHDSRLERTLCSVLDQGHDALECIVAAHGHPDDHDELVSRYADDITAVIREPESTAPVAINSALAAARGDLVAIVSAGDLYMPGAFDAVAQFWRSGGRPPWLLGHVMHIGTEDQLLGRLPSKAPASLAAFLRHDCPTWPMAACFWDRGFFEMYGPMRTGFSRCYDYEYWCRLLAAGQRPRVLPGQDLLAHRQDRLPRSPIVTLQEGFETIAAGALHAHELTWPQRCGLWLNFESRRRIYALAEAELDGLSSSRRLLRQAVRHPWWLADDMFRHTLLHGVQHPVPADLAA